MKTPIDLEKMKDQPCNSFENAFVFFIDKLEDYYNKQGEWKRTN